MEMRSVEEIDELYISFAFFFFGIKKYSRYFFKFLISFCLIVLLIFTGLSIEIIPILFKDQTLVKFSKKYSFLRAIFPEL